MSHCENVCARLKVQSVSPTVNNLIIFHTKKSMTWLSHACVSLSLSSLSKAGIGAEACFNVVNPCVRRLAPLCQGSVNSSVHRCSVPLLVGGLVQAERVGCASVVLCGSALRLDPLQCGLEAGLSSAARLQRLALSGGPHTHTHTMTHYKSKTCIFHLIAPEQDLATSGV